MPSASDIKRLVLQWVQPLSSGIIDAIVTAGAKLKDVSGFGSGDTFGLTFPYGMVAKPIQGVLGYFLQLQGSALAPVIVAYLDKNRPVPSAAGEVIFYCLNADGTEVPVKLTLGVDGKFRLDATTESKVISPKFLVEADTQVKVTCDDVIFDGASTKLGSSGSSEPLILGNIFKTFYNAHTHTGNLGGPTSPPLIPMSSLHVSTKAFTEL